MLLGEQLGDVAFARVGQPREELALLEVEVAVHVLLEVAREAGRHAGEFGVAARARARRAREGLLDAAEQVEVGAMLVVERVADLALEAHRRSNNGIRILEYPSRTGSVH
ncbi:MAG: hypothetical protein M5U30_18360 [Burkholderiaceae bacterium]|nr:hypothetical protein [Burkholderiaceae bacterium]